MKNSLSQLEISQTSAKTIDLISDANKVYDGLKVNLERMDEVMEKNQ